MPITELFLGALINVLLDRLASRELLDFAQREGIDKLLEKWKNRLNRINHMLDDAEDRQLQGDLEVNSWLVNLRNLAYDIDDLLDEFATKSAKNESKADSGCSKAQSLLPSCCFRLRPCAYMLDSKMRSKFKEMDGKLEEIITLKDRLSLGENNHKRSANRQLYKPDPTTSIPDTYFVSRENEKKKILELLTTEDLQVIPIVGMPGVGKTALAQQVYDDVATNCFNVKAWVCVSHDFDMVAITKTILLKTNSNSNSTSSYEDMDLDWLQTNLKKNLSEKKFLVVLDDVWNRDYRKWSELLKPFSSGKKGSKIIVTSRDSEIARDSKIAGIAQARELALGLLSSNACTTLLAFHAFGVGNFDDHPNLKVLGQEIAEKCKGLPLAATTLGGLLNSKVSPHEWENILNSKIWDLQEESNTIPSALLLSYFHLPFDLRRCFAYCAIFPNDYEIERDKLIHWWIAEGLLKGKEGKNHWETGLENFSKLVSRSLFEESSSSESRFLMHDLLNDMAKLVAGATYFRSGDQNNASLARHASFITSEYISPEKFKIYHGMKRLRSFISLDKPSRNYSWVYVSQKVLCDLLSALKYLRVLSLSNYRITEVPESIGKLRYLRYLNLSYTKIKTLPESIVALYNLEALMLRGCDDLLELPKGIEKLINLRFLDISDTRSLQTMPLYVGNLVGLEMLSKFIVGTGNGLRLKELKNLENLRGELCISDLHMVREARDANDANVCMKKGICQLTLQWSTSFENFRNEEFEEEVLDSLCPHKYLKNLTISYYGGPKFPSWLGSPTHINIVHLRLHGCCRAKALPSLGQLSSLKELHIQGLSAICKIGFEFYGTENPFPSLMTLEFKDMPLWEDWSHPISTEEVGFLFPLLKDLVIWNCPVLIGRLPSKLSSLVKLKIESCQRLNASPSIISLPSLNKLYLRDCDEGMLKSLVNLTSLTALIIEEVAELTCLNHGFTSSLSKLEKLVILWCKKLIYLWQDGDVIRNLDCLKSLAVDSCPKFIDFVAEEGDIKLPSNLETIILLNCNNLEKLPSKMHTLSSLKDLIVFNCPKLVSFPETGIPTSLISIHIEDCKMLQFLP